VQTSIAEADHGDELLELLRTGALELAFVSGGDLEPSFASLSLMSDPTVLVVAADSELDGPPSFDDLRSLDLIRHPTMGDLEPRLRDAGIEPRYTIAAEGSVRILGLVAAGVASAILPRLAVDADDARLVVHPLDPLFEPAVLRLVWMRDRPLSPAASAFADHAQRIVRTVRPRPGATPTLAVAAA
jgi:DNA-binding transcriptional LysR family regulator